MMQLNLNEVKQPEELNSVLSWTLGPHLLLPGSWVSDGIRYLFGLMEKLWDQRSSLSMAPFWRQHVSQEVSNDYLTCHGIRSPLSLETLDSQLHFQDPH